MHNLVFMLWMLLFPPACSLCNYVREAKLRRHYTRGQQALSSLAEFAAWVTVGFLLYVS